MFKILIIALGGAIGATLRYGLSGIVYRYMDGVFPWGTLAVNLVGCFAIGFIWQLFEITTTSPNTRAFILIGILGAFTTFSTFGIESFALFREGEFRLAALNIILSNLLGILLVYLGFVTTRSLTDLLR